MSRNNFVISHNAYSYFHAIRGFFSRCRFGVFLGFGGGKDKFPRVPSTSTIKSGELLCVIIPANSCKYFLKSNRCSIVQMDVILWINFINKGSNVRWTLLTNWEMIWGSQICSTTLWQVAMFIGKAMSSEGTNRSENVKINSIICLLYFWTLLSLGKETMPTNEGITRRGTHKVPSGYERCEHARHTDKRALRLLSALQRKKKRT